MAWIGTTSNETAAQLLTRLQGLNDEITVSVRSSSSLAYSANGLTLRQTETETVYEHRGLTLAAANKLAGNASDGTSTAQYYKQIGSTSEYAVASVTVGTRSEYTVSRANDSAGYTVTRTVRVFAADDDSGWSTGSGAGLSADGTTVTVSVDVASSRLAWDVFQIVKTTVKEIRRIDTEAHATTKATANTQTGSAYYTVRKYDTVPTYGQLAGAWVRVTTGTDKSASARFSGVADGWTVTVTEKEYTWDSPTKAQSPSGDGWR